MFSMRVSKLNTVNYIIIMIKFTSLKPKPRYVILPAYYVHLTMRIRYIITLPYQVELARHSMTHILHHSSLSPIAIFSSSVVHPLSSLSCTVYVFCGCPCVRCPCRGSHRSTSLISSSLPRQQCPEKRILCSLIVVVIFGIFPYNS